MLVLFQEFINYVDYDSLLIISSLVHSTYSIRSLKWVVTEKYSWVFFQLLILCAICCCSLFLFCLKHIDGLLHFSFGDKKDAVN